MVLKTFLLLGVLLIFLCVFTRPSFGHPVAQDVAGEVDSDLNPSWGSSDDLGSRVRRYIKPYRSCREGYGFYFGKCRKDSMLMRASAVLDVFSKASGTRG